MWFVTLLLVACKTVYIDRVKEVNAEQKETSRSERSERQSEKIYTLDSSFVEKIRGVVGVDSVRVDTVIKWRWRFRTANTATISAEQKIDSVSAKKIDVEHRIKEDDFDFTELYITIGLAIFGYMVFAKIVDKWSRGRG